MGWQPPAAPQRGAALLSRTIAARYASRFSREQLAYAAAKAAHEVARKRCKENQERLNAEAARLGPDCLYPGTGYPYCSLKDRTHPLSIEAQAFLDVEAAATAVMYAAAHALFDWATETALAKYGTAAQKESIRAMVATVKEQAFVESEFEELVALSMRLGGGVV